MTVRCATVEPHLSTWHTCSLTSTRQQDGHSCGVFVMLVCTCVSSVHILHYVMIVYTKQLCSVTVTFCLRQFVSLTQNALALVKELPLTAVRQQHAVGMRFWAWRYLMHAAQPPPRQRPFCDMMTCSSSAGAQERAINCDVCGRWMHFCCAGLRKAPRGPYVCVICNAQYL